MGKGTEKKATENDANTYDEKKTLPKTKTKMKKWRKKTKNMMNAKNKTTKKTDTRKKKRTKKQKKKTEKKRKKANTNANTKQTVIRERRRINVYIYVERRRSTYIHMCIYTHIEKSGLSRVCHTCNHCWYW